MELESEAAFSTSPFGSNSGVKTGFNPALSDSLNLLASVNGRPGKIIVKSPGAGMLAGSTGGLAAKQVGTNPNIVQYRTTPDDITR